MNRKQKRLFIRIAVSAVLLILVNIIPLPVPVRCVIFAAAYLTAGYDILRKAVLGAGNGRLLDENFLMAVATIGAIALAIKIGRAHV